MARRDSKSRTFLASLPLAVLATFGCGDPEKINLAPKPVFDINIVAKAPELGEPTSIRLRNGPDEIAVGDDVATAIDFYPKPKKSYEVRELPSAFGKEFRAQGWESDIEGFGVISHQGRIVAAMRMLHGVDEARLQNEVTAIRYRIGREVESIEGKSGRYWFWQIGRHRQVVCATPEGKDGFLLTLAIGELNTMDALRLNIDLAKADVKRADRTPSAAQTN